MLDIQCQYNSEKQMSYKFAELLEQMPNYWNKSATKYKSDKNTSRLQFQ